MYFINQSKSINQSIMKTISKEQARKAIQTFNSPFTAEQLDELRRRTPANEIQEKTDSNGFKYKTVSGAYMKNRMNFIFGYRWNFQIISKEYFTPSRETIVHGRLTIMTAGGFEVIKEQFGKHFIDNVTTTKGNTTITAPANVGNGYKAAATDAFKKCASEIGLCWDIYTQEQPEGKSKTEAETYPEDKVYQRLESFMNDAVTPEQVEDLFEQFEASAKPEQRHKDLLDFHMKRTMKK